MARPQKGGDDKRAIMIRVRFTASEKSKLLELAAQAGLTPSDFIRVRTVGGSAQIKKATKDRAALIRLTAELNKVGSNINQIARALNRRNEEGAEIGVSPQIIEMGLSDFDHLSRLIAKELGYDGHQG